MKKDCLIWLIVLALVCPQFGMARHGQYDEEAREAERIAKQMEKENKPAKQNPAKQFASGIKEATVDSTEGLVKDTVEETKEQAPVIGTIEGARLGTGKVLDKTVKGAYKVATFGLGDLKSYEVEQPEANTDDTTKIKISL